MNNQNISRRQKTESLRNALVRAGYDMAASQAESMADDTSFWGKNMIEGKINPKCIDICDQAGQSFYSSEMDIWFKPDKEMFPDSYCEKGLNELIESNGITDDEVFNLLYEGEGIYINERYGADWREKYPEPKYK